jgi:hypothetical protein
MEPVPDPETALRLHPDWAAVRFPNGEWVFGYGSNSHEVFRLGRGTLVMKDSRGQVRIFFGHVCGENAWLGEFPGKTDRLTLDEYYRRLQRDPPGLREWVPEP